MIKLIVAFGVGLLVGGFVLTNARPIQDRVLVSGEADTTHTLSALDSGMIAPNSNYCK